MQVELTGEELRRLLTSLDYSKRAVAEAGDTPPDVRAENLARLEDLQQKLRAARDA